MMVLGSMSALADTTTAHTIKVTTLVIDWTNPDAASASAAIKAAGGFSKGTGSDAKFKMTDDGAKFSIAIENNSGATLPSTGGVGTTIFYVAGSILVLAAAILLITKRRMGNND